MSVDRIFEATPAACRRWSAGTEGSGVMTGFRRFDDITGGLQQGEGW